MLTLTRTLEYVITVPLIIVVDHTPCVLKILIYIYAVYCLWAVGWGVMRGHLQIKVVASRRLNQMESFINNLRTERE